LVPGESSRRAPSAIIQDSVGPAPGVRTSFEDSYVIRND
jgi:hypothetical protein